MSSFTGFMAGAAFSWMSGGPLNEFGAVSTGDPDLQVFLVPRGEAGRCPSVWDLNLRLAYELGRGSRVQPRVIFDVLHVGNPREAVAFDQRRYYAVDEEGNQTAENPTYGLPIRYQPPMSLRLGLEVDF